MSTRLEMAATITAGIVTTVEHWAIAKPDDIATLAFNIVDALEHEYDKRYSNKKEGIGKKPIGVTMKQESLVDTVCNECKGKGTTDMLFFYPCKKCHGKGEIVS